MNYVLFGLALLAAPLSAAHLGACDQEIANVRNVGWDDPTRAYSNGLVRLVRLDTGAPACCAFHLVVLIYDADGEDVLCRLVSNSEGYGWAQMSLAEARADYVPDVGLRIEVPAEQDGAEGLKPTTLVLIINQRSGEVTAQ